MKKFLKVSLLLGVAISLGLSGCLKDSCNREITYFKFTPVYKSYDEIRKPIEVTAPREMKKPGKIYVFNNYLFINEQREGIHVIDNSDAANPRPVSFISIVGNLDMAVRDNVLYVDNYTDLLAIDISDITNARLLCRNENAFPVKSQSADGVLVYYNADLTTEKVDCNTWNASNGIFPQTQLSADVANAPTFSGATAQQVNTSGNKDIAGSTGVAGSMARFLTVKDALYVVDETNLYSYDISNGCGVQKGTVNVNLNGGGVETIFPYKDNLFIGSRWGMFVYNATNPFFPSMISQFTHATSCDPVIANDNTAFITLHSGTNCGGALNQLDIVDISNVSNPVAITTVQMTKPLGLSLLGNILFVCDEGVRVLDVQNRQNPRQISYLKDIKAYDAIALTDQNRLLVIGETGLMQYDCSNPNQLVLLSTIKTR